MAQPSEEHELPRVLNASHATSFVVGIIIGSGIFLVPREMMAAVGSSATVYAVWIVGGLLSLFGAMTYAEIAAARPKYGGEYAFLREAYGDLTAFVFMWTQVTIAKPSSIASIAAGVVRVLGNFSAYPPGARGGFPGFMIALIAALWAYDGWSDVTHTAGEIQNPRRSLPLALIGGVCIVGVLYMMTNAAIQFVLPATAIANADRPAVTAILQSAGPAAAWLFSIGLAISYGSTFIGSSLTVARIPFAAARDGLFFRGLVYVHPRFKTPSRALILQATLSSILLLLINTFQGLFSLAIFSEWLFYAAVTASVFVFRRRETAAEKANRPYSVWGYPVVPALFILAAAVLLVFSFADQPRNSLIGTAIILLGIPLHYLLQRRRPAYNLGRSR